MPLSVLINQKISMIKESPNLGRWRVGTNLVTGLKVRMSVTLDYSTLLFVNVPQHLCRNIGRSRYSSSVASGLEEVFTQHSR